MGARWLLRVPVCPICAGVAGTWLWMIVGRSLGYAIDPGMLAILLGASVAGVAYQVEKRLPPGRSPILWKMLFIPIGLIAAYALAASLWALLAPVAIALALLTAFFLIPGGTAHAESEAVGALKERMRQCC